MFSINLFQKAGIALLTLLAVAATMFAVSHVAAVTRDRYPDGSGTTYDYELNPEETAAAYASVSRWSGSGWRGAYTEVSTYTYVTSDNLMSSGIVHAGWFTLQANLANLPTLHRPYAGETHIILSGSQKFWGRSISDNLPGTSQASIEPEWFNPTDCDGSATTETVSW